MHSASGWKYWLRILATALVFGMALYALSHLLREYHWHEIRERIREIPPTRIALSLLLVAMNYCILIGYDYLALRDIGRPLPWSRIAVASFLGFVASFNLGAIFGGVPVRSRVYSREGLSTLEIAEVIVRVGMAFWLGALGVGGLALMFSPPDSSPLIARIGLSSHWLGVLLIVPVILWLGAASFYRRSFHFRNWEFRLPRPGVAWGQFAVAASDLCLAAGALYVLLPADLNVDFSHFLAMYCLATIAVVLTHVPGGLGVFEAVLLSLCQTSQGHLIASLLTFRVLYYLIPLCCAGLLLAIDEALFHRDKFRAGRNRADSGPLERKQPTSDPPESD